MSEFNSSPNRAHRSDKLRVQDDRATELLARSDVKKGLLATEAKIAEYYEHLKQDGKHTESILNGVTGDGDCINVVRVSDAADLPDVNPNETEYYSVFTYRLDDVTNTDFVQQLLPRAPGDVTSNGCCGKRLYLEHPGHKITMGIGDIRAQRGTIDNELYKELRQQYNAQIKNADQVTFGDVHGPAMYYNGQPILSFNDAAFGKRRQAVIERTVVPLIAERKLHYKLGFGALNGMPQAAVEIAKARVLTDRINAITRVMRDNPDVVDDPGELILDPILAEQMAYKANRINTWKARGRRLLGLFRSKA